ncbi:hypothetical protein FSP39_010433 [Pinctada imbricata]|uniref:Uncharacterized protein n=1 Tax=Pinctada imbricata TaxID=66713 RepID=A0AA88XUY9_PINIB|nr:hypothetical protein FSP39_010433 [Pinctada imbricata]
MEPSIYHTSPNDTDLNGDQWKQGAPRCHHCCSPILDATIVTSGEKTWHRSCFRCMECNCELDEACVTDGRQLYCRYDFDRLFRSPCASCNILMQPSEFVRRVYGNLYHEDCFRCVICRRKHQTGERVYLRDDNKLVCQWDYDRLNKNDLSSDEEDSYQMDLRMGVSITENQAEILTSAFYACANPTRDIKDKLSSQTGLDIRVIQKWFRNKRKFERKHKKRSEFHKTKSLMYANNILKSAGQSISSFTSKSDWLTSLFAADYVPPNVELTPHDIKNGEVCMPLSFIPHNENDRNYGNQQTTPPRWLPCV